MEWRGGVEFAAGVVVGRGWYRVCGGRGGAACAAGAAGMVGGCVWMDEAGLELAWRSWRV